MIADHDEIPGRVAGFHAHLAAEKALKALLIRRGVVIRRIHDLIELRRLLPEDDGAAFTIADLELLNPWTIDGRYPADIAEASARRSGRRSKPLGGRCRSLRRCRSPVTRGRR